MFSRKTAFLIGIVLFVATSFTILTVSSRNTLFENGVERIAISLISPFQMLVSASFAWCTDIWRVYFATVSAGEENSELKRALALAMEAQNRCRELELENNRLRMFIAFDNGSENVLIASKVIGRDPSPWFQTLIINKGADDGIIKGLPVLVSEGVVGQIIEVFEKFSKVLLITDRSSSVDALVQRSRSRGIVQGNNTALCFFKYALRKDEIEKGDIIISSGMDQVFPKGLRIGEVLDIKKENSDLFQMIFIRTFVDFAKLEEVIVSVAPDISVKNNDIYVMEEDEETLLEQPDRESSASQGSKNSATKSVISFKQERAKSHQVITPVRSEPLPSERVENYTTHVKKSAKSESSKTVKNLRKKEQ